MTYIVPSTVPATYQSRPDSAPNKSYNCGPSSVTHVARYFRDVNFGINATRLLAGIPNYRGTMPSERATMLTKRGVPCKVDRISAGELIALVRSGRRPVSVSMLMSKVPFPYRQYSFTGFHELAAVAVRSGFTPDMAFMDPNYGWPNGTTGYRPPLIWMPYSVWMPACLAAGWWCVIPTADKVIPTRLPYVKTCTVTGSGVNIRSGPGTNYTRVATATKGATFRSVQIEKAGGAYVYNGATRRDWLSFVRSGRVVWIARAFVKEA